MWWNCFSQHVQSHSHSVGHRNRCHNTAFHNMCNLTHILFVIENDVIRLPFTKCAISLTSCWSWEKVWWDCLSQNVQSHSLSVGHRKRCDETTFQRMCNVIFTHKLLAITGKYVMRLPYIKCAMPLTSCWSQEKMWWDCLSQNVQYHSLAVGHRKSCDETAFHNMCNVTHFLLKVIVKDVMRLLFTKCAMSLTCCWL